MPFVVNIDENISATLEEISQKLDKIMSFLSIPPTAEPKLKSYTPVKEKRTRAKRDNTNVSRARRDLLLGRTRSELSNTYGQQLQVHAEFDPKYSFGGTERQDRVRIRRILDDWFEGTSLPDIYATRDYADAYTIKRIIQEYYASFGSDDIFAPTPLAKEKLSSIKYRDGNLIRIAKLNEVPLVQVVRDYLDKKSPLLPLDHDAHAVLCNHLISVNEDGRDIDSIYFMDPLSKDRVLRGKDIVPHLRWINIEGTTLYRVAIRTGKYLIETKQIGNSRWNIFQDGTLKSDPEELYKLLDGIARRQIRGE